MMSSTNDEVIQTEGSRVLEKGDRVRVRASSGEWCWGILSFGIWSEKKKAMHSTVRTDMLDYDDGCTMGYGADFVQVAHSRSEWECIVVKEYQKQAVASLASSCRYSNFFCLENIMGMRFADGEFRTFFMSDSLATRLGVVCRENKVIQKVRLSDISSRYLGQAAFESLVAGLLVMPRLEELYLTDYHRCAARYGKDMQLDFVAKLIPLSKSLRHFQLGNSFLPKPDLVEGLLDGRLKELSLRSIKSFTQQHAIALKKAFRKNDSILSVKLYRCSKEIVHASLRGLSGHSTLTSIHVEFCDLSNGSIRVLGSFLSSPAKSPLTNVNMPINFDSSRRYQYIARGLRNCNKNVFGNLFPNFMRTVSSTCNMPSEVYVILRWRIDPSIWASASSSK